MPFYPAGETQGDDLKVPLGFPAYWLNSKRPLLAHFITTIYSDRVAYLVAFMKGPRI